ncbi:sensor histidine kinase [Marinomonas spartinae]|uniref:sensor histidine kinase n=1 Tax=Marinomonas spartinae TaxID=1792290 RepID=UPI0018F1E931|nr:sensor histidine kinase KdpD [Marinomonas spartinae]MBJ7554706.1 sensor histidine kinase KdpD [Marinomonas spartinae]
MSEEHRDQKADAILNALQQSSQGKLTIFIGAAPGVGKTYAMISAAKESVQQGVEVLVGLLETHGRKETQDIMAGLNVLPRKEVHYHDTVLTEFDLDAALEQKPELILVDELAHTNVPGSRHTKRYQDIAELLAAGINVYTTVNVQHILSLRDVVAQITGVTVHESVPDNVIDDAYDIRFIDLPPIALIDRLKQGKVYLPEYARVALDTFFSLSNLSALRELAMKRAMHQVDSYLETALMQGSSAQKYAIRDKLIVLVSASSDHCYLVRLGRQIAERRQIAWCVVWVDRGITQNAIQRKHLNNVMNLAKDLGAQVDTLRGENCYAAILPYLEEQRVNTVLVGSGAKHRWGFWKKRLYQQLIESNLPLEVCVYRSPEIVSQKTNWQRRGTLFGDYRGHIYGVIGVALATLIAWPLQQFLSSGNLVLLYVISIVLVGLKYGTRPALATAIWAFLSFNFFLTEPIYTFKVNQQDDIATLVFLVVLGMLSGPAASRIRNQFILLKESNRYTEALKDMAQRLSVVESEVTLWDSLCEKASSLLGAKCFFAYPEGSDNESHVKQVNFSLSQVEESAIAWSLTHGEQAGRFTQTLNASRITVLPVKQENIVIGGLLIRWSAEQEHFLPFERDLVESMLQQGASTWRRVRLVSDLESARVKTEVEQIRSSLLSSVSHDLKSPLSAMMGAAESLKMLDKQLSVSDKEELVDTILQESHRLDSYIQNLLDMTRLGYGGLKIQRDWVSVDDIIGSALNRLKRYFSHAKVNWAVTDDAPVLYVHAALIEQALFNILENAVRYSPEKEAITVKLIVDAKTCRITIEDKGPGIPKDEQEHIFNMFYIVSDGDKKSKSTGMGLAICRGMIGAHGGTVCARNGAGGKGTRFIVELPLEYGKPNS